VTDLCTLGEIATRTGMLSVACALRTRGEIVTRFVPCRECGGTGYAWFSRGGVDPAAHTTGSCEYCHGDGRERCSECQEPATDAWIEPGNADYGERVFPLGSEHMAQYVAAAADE